MLERAHAAGDPAAASVQMEIFSGLATLTPQASPLRFLSYLSMTGLNGHDTVSIHRDSTTTACTTSGGARMTLTTDRRSPVRLTLGSKSDVALVGVHRNIT